MNIIKLVGLVFIIMMISNTESKAQKLQTNLVDGSYIANVNCESKTLIKSPDEGLWSIALEWKDQWPANWKHAIATEIQEIGEWKILTGKLALPKGEWNLKDSYREEDGRIKCIRRFEWRGKQTLDSVTLSIRWQTPARNAKAFLPGIMYYGNPSGEKNRKNNVAWFHGTDGEEALFEEHRYPMPFASVEWQQNNSLYGAALHTIPSPVYCGNQFDQWWSLGVKANRDNTELLVLSGPVAYNGKKSVVKALKSSSMPYGDTYINVKPGTVIEKTFYLQAYPVSAKGTGFQKPVYTSIDLFKPFYTDDLPTYNEIVKLKYRFAQSRWIEGTNYAGFNMYPPSSSPRIVAGWAGQSETPAYALQVLADDLKDERIWNQVQRSLDHICSSPMDTNGFCVSYDIRSSRWSGKDPVSQGQAMNSIVLAVKAGRNNKNVTTVKWEEFLLKACDIYSSRILALKWNPRNTAEVFFISPLVIASELFKNEQYKEAALKAADYYASRHITMDEPYWGGTLDATCEERRGRGELFRDFWWLMS